MSDRHTTSASASERDGSRMPPSLARRIRLSRLALAWERGWRALWPATATVGGFIAVSLLGLWSWLPAWLHAAGLVLFAGCLGYALWRAARDFTWPSRVEAERRLERGSASAHRPLGVLQDHQISGGEDPASRGLWELHRRRMARRLAGMRVGWPHPGLIGRDPMALRAALGLVLVVGFVAAGGNLRDRLFAAFVPNFATAQGLPEAVEAWITPPEYTGFAPIFLTPTAVGPLAASARSGEPAAAAGAERQVDVPIGSQFLARVSGGRGVPQVAIGDRSEPFATIDPLNYQAEVKIEGGERLAITREERTVAAWRLNVIPDHAPVVGFAAPPKPTVRKALELGYAAKDDYGLVSVRAIISRAGTDETIEIEMPLAGARLKTAQDKSFHDLTPHPWAGFPVQVRLSATDALGQIGESESLDILLPERDFTHPVARALIEQRRNLTAAPESREKVAMALAAISLLPDSYNADSVVHLALQTGRARLKYDARESAIPAVQSLLWDTALRLEEGSLSLAQQRLRELQKELQDALARNAPDEEIERLMKELREAMDKYLQALMEQAMKRAERGEMQPLDPSAMQLQELDLQEMLKRAEELARMGARDAARELLSQLQNMLENLRAGVMQGQPQQGGQQAMRGLSDLLRQQQELLDQTFRQQQQGRGGQGQGQDPGAMGGLSERQEALRRRLGEIMRQLGEGGMPIPGPMGQAEQQMRDARDALGRSQPGQAVGPQTQALDLLRQGAESLMQSFMGDGDMLEGGQEGMQAQDFERDPFGRFSGPGGAIDDNRVKIPEKADLQRAREILEELYRRSGERTRSLIERDYIERLLKRF